MYFLVDFAKSQYTCRINVVKHVICLLQSEKVGMNPLYLMLPGVIAASFAFMLPVATPPNAIVFANGYLKVTDMVCIATNIRDMSV